MPSGFVLRNGLTICVTILLLKFFPAYTIHQSFALTVLALSTFIAIARAVYHVILYPIFFTPFKHLPMPPNRSLLNGHFAILRAEPAGHSTRQWTKEVPNNGLLRYYLFGNLERILPISPKALSEVLVSKCYDFEKPRQVRFGLGRVLGEGILFEEGDVHKRQRRLLNPAFSFRHVKDLYPIFWKKGVEMIKAIERSLEESSDDPKTIRISDWASRATLDIIGLAGMDHDFDSVNNPTNRLNKEYRKIFSSPGRLGKLLQFLSLVVSPPILGKLPMKRNRDINEGAKYVRSVCQQMVQEKREKMEMEKKETRSVDILSIAMESGGFTDDELVSQMMTFLAAGHETTASALQWTIYALCKHPEIQNRLREEVRSSLPSADSATPITSSHIDSLSYLNAVCSEVLRFYAPVPLTIRQAVRDTMVLDTFIPKGTAFSISPAATNHNPELWGPDAGEFNPERWMGPGRANTGGADSNYSFLTFIHGPRSCIGAAFARAELACLVAVMVGRFEMELLEPEKKLEIKDGVTGTPMDGVVVKPRVLDGW
ncbi:hypothetical protein AJ79_03148 [Helicocarpus griseus UAMH5409]|uniref:Cytochrome P450 monooxygenase n=1 Tax=Helicocarpus griseus UAMH5409 TaxID=1447875 RepID=A0A2B7XYN6_9EURO|nr:hypothetical protein AJ79_03148 [Helicocarpus griseus UAMH5409]